MGCDSVPDCVGFSYVTDRKEWWAKMQGVFDPARGEFRQRFPGEKWFFYYRIDRAEKVEYECHGKAVPVMKTYDFSKPFELQITIQTDPVKQGAKHGGIFDGRSPNARVELHWLGSGHFQLQMCSTAIWDECA